MVIIAGRRSLDVQLIWSDEVLQKNYVNAVDIIFQC